MKIQPPTGETIIYHFDSGDEPIQGDASDTSASNEEFSTSIRVRFAESDDKTWKKAVNVMVGDTVEYLIQYQNLSEETQCNVGIRIVLSEHLQYIEGSTIIYNSRYPDGLKVSYNNITNNTNNGVNIGSYTGATDGKMVRMHISALTKSYRRGLDKRYKCAV